VTPDTLSGQGVKVLDSPGGQAGRLNSPVTEAVPDTSYPLARALGARLVGRSLVTLAALVAVATLVGALTGAGWVPAGIVAVLGAVLVAVWAWWLTSRARALSLTSEGYAVRLLAGVGVASAPWSRVAEATATSPGGERCLLLTLTDGRTTRLPMSALDADADVVASDVLQRLRDAHTAGEAAADDPGEGPADGVTGDGPT